MKRETHRAGTQLFRRGDPADSLYLVVEGVVMLEEEEKRIEAGEVFGELGMFRKDTARTMTVTCAEDCTLDRLGRDKAFELCYQHPKFGIYLLRLIAGYVPELKRTPHEASLELERLPV
jgi:CRP/FNR family cyclic AMP-dependent transcriptional regulator